MRPPLLRPLQHVLILEKEWWTSERGEPPIRYQTKNRVTLEMIDDFLAEFAALIEPVEARFLWRPQVRDPSDEMVLEAAINGKADALVTYNVRDFAAAGERFSIPILPPQELLRRVRL